MSRFNRANAQEQTKPKSAGSRGGRARAPSGLTAPQSDSPIALAAAGFVRDTGDLIRWRGDWYLWDGQCWRSIPKDDVRSLVYKWAAQGNWPLTRREIGDLVGALEGLYAHLDPREPPFWIGEQPDDPPAKQLRPFRNGVLDLRDPHHTTLRPPDRRLFTLSRIECDYDPNAEAPGWEQFLREVFPDDAESQRALEEQLGYMLVDDTSLQKFFVWVGLKRSDKGTIGRVVQRALGPGRTCNPTLGQFGQVPFGRESLIGRSVALVSDSRGVDRQNVHGAVEALLAITGEDSQTIQRKHISAWHGRLPTRIVIMSNQAVHLRDATGVVISRMIAVHFSVSFYGREDPTLTDKLCAELPGIVNRWLGGLRRLHERGYFEQPTSARHLIEQMDRSASPVRNFVEDECTVGPEQSVSKNTLYDKYKTWCYENGHQSGSADTFARDLYALGLGIRSSRPRTEDGKREWVFEGIWCQPSPF